MVTLGALWQPIILSAILVFILSAIIHMVLKYHNSDYRPFANEDAVRAAIRAGNPGPAQYVIPYCAEMKDMEKPEVKQKYIDGPIAVINIKPNGAFTMGPTLGQWFVVSSSWSRSSCAYVAVHTIPAGTPYLEVFRVVGAVAFLAYAFGQIPAADLDGKAVGGGDQGSVRRAALRAGDRGDLRLALATLKEVVDSARTISVRNRMYREGGGRAYGVRPSPRASREAAAGT